MGPSALTAPAATIQCQTHQLGALSCHTQRKQLDILAAETRQIALSSSLIRLFSHREAQAWSCDPPARSIDAVLYYQRVWWAYAAAGATIP